MESPNGRLERLDRLDVGRRRRLRARNQLGDERFATRAIECFQFLRNTGRRFERGGIWQALSRTEPGGILDGLDRFVDDRLADARVRRFDGCDSGARPFVAATCFDLFAIMSLPVRDAQDVRPSRER